MSCCDSIMVRSPSKKTGWSSTLRMRMAAGIFIDAELAREAVVIRCRKWRWEASAHRNAHTFVAWSSPRRRAYARSMKQARRIAIIGGARIPFARQDTNYVEASNLQMLAAALQGVVARFGLKGKRLGEVAAGAVIKH